MGNSDTPQTLIPVFDVFSLPRVRRARLLRRILLLLLVAFIAVGAGNGFGPRIVSTSATAGGYSLTVTHPSVIRPGLAAPWKVIVLSEDGFDDSVTIATTSDYFDIFDENGLDPQPSSSRSLGSSILVWEFDAPLGNILAVDFDARIEPTLRGNRRGMTSVVEDGRAVVSVRYRTIVMP